MKARASRPGLPVLGSGSGPDYAAMTSIEQVACTFTVSTFFLVGPVIWTEDVTRGVESSSSHSRVPSDWSPIGNPVVPVQLITKMFNGVRVGKPLV